MLDSKCRVHASQVYSTLSKYTDLILVKIRKLIILDSVSLVIIVHSIIRYKQIYIAPLQGYYSKV